MNTRIILIWRWSNESVFKVDYVRRQNLLDLEWAHLGYILGTVTIRSLLTNYPKSFRQIQLNLTREILL